MKISNVVKGFGIAALALSATATGYAQGEKVGMLIGYDSVENENPQECAAAKWFVANYPDGVIITPADADKINAENLEAIWVHIDRVGLEKGAINLPLEFRSNEMMAALKSYVRNGGNLYLSKFAVQMLGVVGRVNDMFAPGIFGNGDGGKGTDVWAVNAHLGSWQINPDNQEPDETQIYDHRGHAVYEGLEEFEPWSEWGNFPHNSFPMLGSGDGSELWREDHNCMWDLNAYSYEVEGKNTLEKFEATFDCEVIGTWGHVQDYCVAGIVDFAPTADITGRIVANGLAACEWAPREGVNKYHSNLEMLTANTLRYLAPSLSTAVETIDSESEAAPVFYNIQGQKVANPEKGMFIKVANGKASKVILK